MPESDKVVLFVAQAGPQGITRYKLGRAIKLEPQVLNDLLDALVGAGLLTRSLHGELRMVSPALMSSGRALSSSGCGPCAGGP